MAKNLISRPILALLAEIWAHKIWFYIYQWLEIVSSYHSMQFKGKLMNQTWDNYNKSNFGNDFGLFGPPVFFFQKSDFVSH